MKIIIRLDRVMADRKMYLKEHGLTYFNNRREAADMSQKVYEYESLIYNAEQKGGAYVIFPYDLREEFGKGRVKVHVTFDGEPYDGSIVNMGVKNEDGSICYIIGIRKDIRARIGKQPGDRVHVTVAQQQL